MLEKSCACTDILLSPAEIPAGADGQIELTWFPKPDQLAAGDVTRMRVWAVVGDTATGWQRRVEAEGRLDPALKLNLPRGKLDFGRLDPADLAAGSREVALEIFTKKQDHKGFQISGKVRGPGLRVHAISPLEPTRLAALQAVAGFRVAVRAETGLPVGPFRVPLTLTSSIYPEPLEIGVEGSHESGAVTLQPDRFNLATARLSLAQGFRSPPLKVVLRYEDDRALEIVEVQPPLFRVAATKVKPNEWSLILSLREEADLRANLAPTLIEEFLTFGFEGGFVRCQTNHSQVPELKIPITSGRCQP